MNINPVSNYSPNFKALYVDTEGMGAIAKSQASSLERALAYDNDIDTLDSLGVDVVIIKDPKNQEDRAKIIFADPDNRLYKINGKDHLKTGKTYDRLECEYEYSDNHKGVKDAIKGIISGRIFEKTTRPTNTLREMVQQIPIRLNNMAGSEFEGFDTDFGEPEYFDDEWDY